MTAPVNPAGAPKRWAAALRVIMCRLAKLLVGPARPCIPWPSALPRAQCSCCSLQHPLPVSHHASAGLKELAYAQLAQRKPSMRVCTPGRPPPPRWVIDRGLGSIFAVDLLANLMYPRGITAEHMHRVIDNGLGAFWLYLRKVPCV